MEETIFEADGVAQLVGKTIAEFKTSDDSVDITTSEGVKYQIMHSQD